MNLNHIAKKPFFDLFYAKPIMPQLLRAALYDASAVNADGSVRGPKATSMLKGQQAIAHSKELKEAMKEIKTIKNYGNHITHMLSVSDLIQLGGYAAVEYCGGPSMVFRMGRVDTESEPDAVDHEAEGDYNSLNVARLSNLSLGPEDFVALIGGSHTLGFRGAEKKGAHSRWTQNPYVFDNSYFKEVLLREEGRYYKGEVEQRLARDPEMRQWCEAYAQDETLFFSNFARAHVALSELNCNTLMGEMDEKHQVDGGYQEPSRFKAFAEWFGRDQALDDQEDMVTLGEFKEIQAQLEATPVSRADSDDEHH